MSQLMKGGSVMASCVVLLATGTMLSAASGVPEQQLQRIDVATVPFDQKRDVRSATFTPSGRILVSYADGPDADRRFVTLATMDDDGKNMRTFFSQAIPARAKDNGLRFMVFPDNRRIFLGDFVIECAPSIDRCDHSALLPVTYPREVADGDQISHRWSEMIVAPDNRHIAWTTLLANYAAVVLTGELKRSATGYTIAKPAIISTIEPFEPDPKHADGVIPAPMRGGEVKQFVNGGTAISLVGAVRRDVPDSVVQHLDDGVLEGITDTPGYNETTIFSPDQRLGITMTTRFSPNTDPGVLGVLPRPYPASLNMGLSMFAYTYGVVGVRSSRPGNVGPALIDIAASKSVPGYMGSNLSRDEDWVFRSPMSWQSGGKKALWIEGKRGTESRRIRMATLPDYRPGKPVAARSTPDAIPYASHDLSVIAALAEKSRNIDVKVYGRAAGYVHYRRSPATIEKAYFGYSDDGKSTYSGDEKLAVNPQGNSVYEANIRLEGSVTGKMALKITFGPLSGKDPAQIIFTPDASGKPQSYGYSEYAGKRLEVSTLVP